MDGPEGIAITVAIHVRITITN